jgi:hypothetical protein
MRERRTHLKQLAMLVVLSAALFTAAACTASAPPNTTPSIRGVVTSIEATAEGGSMRVVWAEDPVVGPKAEHDAAQVSVDANTNVWRMTSAGEVTRIEFSEIVVGDVVMAWFGGAVAESYPVQATATDVVVSGRYAGELPVPAGLEPELQPEQ